MTQGSTLENDGLRKSISNIPQNLTNSVEVTKAQANSKIYTDLLILLKVKYDALVVDSSKILNMYSNQKINDNGRDHDSIMDDIRIQESSYNSILTSIDMIINDKLNEKIDFRSIDNKYDSNAPFSEEGNIVSEPIKYKYRKIRYKTMSDKYKLEYFMQKIRNKINENDRIINNYVNNKPLHDD